MKFFGWLMGQNRILTMDNLQKRGMYIINRCTPCKKDLESVTHLSNECSFTKNFYTQVTARTGILVP